MNIDIKVFGNLTEYDFGATVDFEMEPDFIVNVDAGKDYCDVNIILYADGSEMSEKEADYWLAELDEEIRAKAGDKYDDAIYNEYRGRRRHW